MIGTPGKPLDLDCGIPYARIASWLDGELHLPKDDARWVFSKNGGKCFIELEPLENRTFRHVSLERSRLVTYGDEGALEPFRELFTLRFISAGG